ncbi:MAG: hypothetical protein KJS64_02135 [Acidobacteria bacterium]|nr:hypothetical protein [Acidobacteriota bacterium]
MLASVFVVALQTAIVSSYRIAGIAVMIVWLWPLCVGLVGNTPSGIVAGATSGLLFDTHVATPFGLFTVTGALIGYAAGLLGREDLGDLRGAAWWMPLLIGGSCGLITPLVFVILGFCFGDIQLWRGDVGATMVVNAFAFGLLLRPAVRMVRIAVGESMDVRR